jgi:phage shock protein A
MHPRRRQALSRRLEKLERKARDLQTRAENAFCRGAEAIGARYLADYESASFRAEMLRAVLARDTR